MEPIASSTVITFGGVILLLQIANMAVNIFAKLRRSPPIDQTLRDYVRKDEFDKLRDELRRADAKLFDLVREITARNATWTAGISAQLGRLEAAVESMKGQK